MEEHFVLAEDLARDALVQRAQVHATLAQAAALRVQAEAALTAGIASGIGGMVGGLGRFISGSKGAVDADGPIEDAMFGGEVCRAGKISAEGTYTCTKRRNHDGDHEYVKVPPICGSPTDLLGRTAPCDRPLGHAGKHVGRLPVKRHAVNETDGHGSKKEDAQRVRDRYRARKVAGLCPRCGKTTTGGGWCSACLRSARGG